MLYREQFVSRATFCAKLHLGEGAVKTLISHLKNESIVDSIRSGTFLTHNGKKYVSELFDIMPRECNVEKCNVAREKYNHAILLKKYQKSIKSGMQQRDYAILYGASGATTLVFTKNKFVFPGDGKNAFSNDKKTELLLREGLQPESGDVVIIASSKDPFVAEISAKNSALWTIAEHEKH